MRAKRLNLCETIRNLLEANQISTVKVVEQINAELGGLEAKEATGKLGAGTYLKKNKVFRITESISTKYTGKETIPLRFDRWNSHTEKGEKIVGITELKSIPTIFADWLNKFKVTPTPETEEQEQEQEQTS